MLLPKGLMQLAVRGSREAFTIDRVAVRTKCKFVLTPGWGSCRRISTYFFLGL